MNDDYRQFLTELRIHIVDCRYDATFEPEILRDRLVAGCKEDRIRERLFMEPDRVTLDQVIALAQTVERANLESHGVSKPSDVRKHSTKKFCKM